MSDSTHNRVIQAMNEGHMRALGQHPEDQMQRPTFAAMSSGTIPGVRQIAETAPGKYEISKPKGIMGEVVRDVQREYGVAFGGKMSLTLLDPGTVLQTEHGKITGFDEGRIAEKYNDGYFGGDPNTRNHPLVLEEAKRVSQSLEVSGARALYRFSRGRVVYREGTDGQQRFDRAEEDPGATYGVALPRVPFVTPSEYFEQLSKERDGAGQVLRPGYTSPEMEARYIALHEVGHVYDHHLRKEEEVENRRASLKNRLKQMSNKTLGTQMETPASEYYVHTQENMADSFAAFGMVKAHGMEGYKFMHVVTCARSIGASAGIDTHYTSPSLRAANKRAFELMKSGELEAMTPEKMAEEAHAICKEHCLTPEGFEKFKQDRDALQEMGRHGMLPDPGSPLYEGDYFQDFKNATMYYHNIQDGKRPDYEPTPDDLRRRYADGVNASLSQWEGRAEQQYALDTMLKAQRYYGDTIKEAMTKTDNPQVLQRLEGDLSGPPNVEMGTLSVKERTEILLEIEKSLQHEQANEKGAGPERQPTPEAEIER